MKHYFSSLTVSIILLVAGCAPDHVIPITGNMIGNVALTTSPIVGSQIVKDFSGVRVRLVGIEPAIEVISNSKGYWEMKDVPSGTYNVEYSKEGYGVYMQFGIQHVGGEVPSVPYLGILSLGPLPKSTIESVKLNSTITMETVQYLVTGPIANERVIAFISNNGEASPTNYDMTGSTSTNDTGNYIVSIYPWNLKNVYGYETGDQVSVAFYATTGERPVYYDPHYNVNIYATLSKTGKEIKFKMP